MKDQPNNQSHWDHIYQTKVDVDVGWFQPIPVTSLEIIDGPQLGLDSAIIDVGGGNANLTEQLIDRGFRDLNVLDISANALARTQKKIGPAADDITWIVSNVIDCDQLQAYDVWHDRAAFHFLLEEHDIQSYVNQVKTHLKPGGHMVLATFSLSGPRKCSGLPITQYSAAMLDVLFGNTFTLKQAMDVIHVTPSGYEQAFTYTLFQKQS